MADQKIQYSIEKLCAPLPATQRGYGIHLDANLSKGKLLYCNGRSVIIRSLEDPSQAELFSEHKGKACIARFAPNGNWVASGDDRGIVYIWDYNKRTVKLEVPVCKKILDIAWSDDGKRVVAVGDGADNFAKVFMWDSGNNVGEITTHSGAILAVDFKKTRPFRIVTCSEDRTVNFYEGPPFKYKHSFQGHDRYPNCVRFSPDGEKYATVGADKKIFIFDAKTGELQKELTECKDNHTGSIYSFSWSPCSQKILTASSDKTAKIWNVAAGGVETTFTFGKELGDQQVSTMWIGEFLITVSLNGRINYLDINNPSQPKRKIEGHQVIISGLDVDKQNQTAYTSDHMGVVTKWDLRSGLGQWVTGKGHGGKPIPLVCVNANSTQFVTAGLDDSVSVNSIADNAFSGNSVSLGGLPVALAVGKKDPNLIVAVTSKQTMVVIGKGNPQTTNLGFKPTCVAIDSSDSMIAVGGEDKKLHLYKLGANGAATASAVREKHPVPINAVAFSPDGKFVASGCREKYIYVWGADGNTANTMGWRFHMAAITSIDFSPGFQRAVTGSVDQNLIVWNDMKGLGMDRITIQSAHIAGVTGAMFANDNTVVSAGHDCSLKIWSL